MFTGALNMLKQREENPVRASCDGLSNLEAAGADDQTCDALVKQIKDCSSVGSMGEQGEVTLEEICQKACCEYGSGVDSDTAE